MAHFTPFADDTAALTIGDLSIENGLKRITLSGALDVTLDRQGLARVEALKAVVDAVVQVLAGTPHLTDTAPAEAAKHGTRKNPFT